MTASSSSCHLRLLLRSQPPSPSPSSSSSFISFLKPFFLPSSNALSSRLPQLHLRKTLFPSLLSTPSSSSRAFSYTPPLASLISSSSSLSIDEDAFEETNDDGFETETETETERDSFEDTQVEEMDSTSSPLVEKREERLNLKVPILSVKERKELASYAHSLGKKLNTQLVGKSGVTPNVVTAFNDNLEANELLKIKIHGSCPGEFDDIVKQLEEATGSVTVGQIGRTMILYRPSLSKLKVEEKKKQVRKLFLEKQQKRRLMNRSKEQEQVPKLSRRGSSWKVRGSRS